MAIDLAFVWAILIAFAVLAYVMLDGFDLGIGILFPASSGPEQRDVMINSVAPVWDGNETWLVLGGGGLFAAFPLAYAVLLPALYAPLTAMLLALVLRGVAFEFRFRTERAKWAWDCAFWGGSVLAALAQGIALGAFIQGFVVDGRAYAGGWFDWLTPFSIMTGIAVVVGYALLGATWLIMKTEGALQHWCFRITPPLAAAVVGLIVIVSIWTPLLDPAIAARWFGWPNIVLVAPVPLLVAGTSPRPLPSDQGTARAPALPAVAGPVRALLRGPGNQPVSLRRAAPHHHLGGGGTAGEPGLSPGRRADPDPDHPRLHRACLLDLPRQGRSRRRLPLSPPRSRQAAAAAGLVCRTLGCWRCGACGGRLCDQTGARNLMVVCRARPCGIWAARISGTQGYWLDIGHGIALLAFHCQPAPCWTR